MSVPNTICTAMTMTMSKVTAATSSRITQRQKRERRRLSVGGGVLLAGVSVVASDISVMK
jgi:hypothetical protein